ncbi:MAG: 3-dehydroquinate synthase [Phycisphaeraceae bacterium]|nr:MAG: 3-dehydroquinate synthase [Phycisphaeraceae bacterium]
MSVRCVRVEPASAPAYDVRIGSGVAREFAGELPILLNTNPGRLFAVIDAGVPGAWVDDMLGAYESAGFAVSRHAIEPSEQGKSIETFHALLTALASSKLERREPVLAIGGGIVGDIAGFAAASYRRGVPVIQCPTTLLAAVDASVGGKTGINLSLPGDGEGPALLKNMAGAFHQPLAVLADLDALASLPDRPFRCGLGECVKHGLMSADWGDAGLLAWTRTSIDAIARRDPDVLGELIARNVGVKARVVAADEREQSDTGGRALLNLGHTYAHAMETIGGLTPDGDPAHAPLQHGEAVALGLVAAAACSAALGRITPSDFETVRDAVGACGLPTLIAGLPDDATLIARMGHDKKASGGRLRLTLLAAIGRGELVTNPPLDAVATGWSAIRG